MSIPTRVKVGPYHYSIVVNRECIEEIRKEKGTGYVGFIRYSDGEILLDPAQTESAMRATVFHEVVHGAFDFTGDNASEPLVTRVAHVVLMIMRDNPDLVAYLMEQSNGT